MDIYQELRRCMIVPTDEDIVHGQKYTATSRGVRILSAMNGYVKQCELIVVTFKHVDKKKPMTMAVYAGIDAVRALFDGVKYAIGKNALIHGDAPYHWECRFYGNISMGTFVEHGDFVATGAGRGLPYRYPMDHDFIGGWELISGLDDFPDIDQPTVSAYTENDGDTTEIFHDAEECIQFLVDNDFTMYTNFVYYKGSKPSHMAMDKSGCPHLVNCPGAFTDSRLKIVTDVFEWP